MQALAETAGWEAAVESAAGRARLQLVDGPTMAAPPWQDKLQAVPAMRSALIPLEEDEAEGWSKPFSLLKADFEPWTSYHAGYCSSRLFLGSATGEAGRLELDYPLQALLALRKLDPALILEPLVQIEGPVEYFDAARASQAHRDRSLAESLARAAEAMHRNQLRRAREWGVDLGNRLHDALLGDGLSNLIRAWEKAHGRKPSPHELHIMLTTGRIDPIKAAEPVVPAMRTPARPQPAPVPAAAVAIDPVSPKRTEPLPSARPAHHSPTSPEPRGSCWYYLIHLAGAAGMGALIYLLVQ